MAKVHVSTRSRNLGFGWTNSCEQSPPNSRGDTFLRVCQVVRPLVTGGLRTIEAELDRACRINSGGASWALAWFVGGRKVTGPDSHFFPTFLRSAGTKGMDVEVDGPTAHEFTALACCSACGTMVDDRPGWTYCSGGGPVCGDRCPDCGTCKH